MSRVYLHIGNNPSFTDVALSDIPRPGDIFDFRSQHFPCYSGTYRVESVRHQLKNGYSDTHKIHMHLVSVSDHRPENELIE